jgi:basic membrane protein A
MKKILSAILVVCMILSLALSVVSCSTSKTITKENIKIGLITLHDDSSTYDKNFIESMKRALQDLGIKEEQLVLSTSIEETSQCYDTAKQMVKDGCDVIFADSFGHEAFLLQAAQEFPKVKFCHATGTMAHTAKLDNFSNAFAAIYEGRYLAGIAAGMKLKEMIDSGKITAEQAIVGYVGAYTYAEVMSGYTSFFLGVRSVVPSATMKVRFTGSWYDTDTEYSAAKALIETDKCVLISQHADSYGAPNACEEAKVPNISYNGSTESQGPNTYIVSSKIDWAPYFKYMINCTIEGKVIDKDWTGTIDTGSVVLLDLSKNAAAGTQEAIDSAKAALKAGTLHVFDTSKFTVGGQTLTTYKADVDTDDKYTPDTEAIKDGYFHESEYRSAPYFNIKIDGISIIGDEKY